MRYLAAACASAALCGVCSLARADDPFVRQSVPRKWLEPVLPESLPELQYPTYYSDLEKARLESFTGRYKQSLQTLLKVPATVEPVQVALIKATSLAATGRYDRALQALSGDAVANDAKVQVKRATILYEMGRGTEAISLLKDHLVKYPNSIAGHFELGNILEKTGDIDGARTAYDWFMVDPQNFLEKWQQKREEAFNNSAEDITYVGRAIDRWATLTGSYKDLPMLNDALYALFVRTYDVVDRDYWPAHVAAAEYALSHDDTTKAIADLTDAADRNPSDARVCELFGQIAVSQWNFDAADSMVTELRKVNPTSIAADNLEARNLLQQRRPKDAMIPLQQALEKQPNNIESMGLLAASYALQLKDDDCDRVLKQVEKIDPDNATAYQEVADQLGAMRQYPRAAKMYKVAIERAPWWTDARNGLGLLYTQSGDEDDAKITLDAAHTLDPYNLRTTNYLRLLDSLSKFAKKESEHFIVMYDASIDPIIPEYFTDYLESIDAQVSGAFKTHPPVKTYIEVFPTHDAFSVRTTGSPWIGTVGASTGRVIAMVAPRAGTATMGPFNWSQVLRHEYTHTVTLAATDNRIPHWMTEGLAVYEEQTPIKWEWVPMLYNAVTKNELFPLDKLTWGFIRPRKPSDRSMAYAESFWLCKFIEETRGHDTILKMLAEFKAGASEEGVFQKVLGKSMADLQVEFFDWASKQVAGWGYDKETSDKYTELVEKGKALIDGRKYAEAAQVWEEIVKLRPVDALPHQRLAGLYLTKELNQPEKAIEHLKVLHAVELKDNRYAKRIARLYRDLNDLPNAKKYAMDSLYIDPYDLDAHNLVLEIATKASDQPSIDREKRVIPILEKWIETNRPKQLPG
jgi:tetratricopeptide (TPR) repeat protein